MAVWINEFHYDNIGTDTGEFIELAGTAGTDLTGWSIVRYNGSTPTAAVTYSSPGSITVGGVIPNESNGFGTVVFTLPTDGVQNGGNDGFALVDNNGAVVQLLSYEGVFTVAAGQGAAAGLTSTDVGVVESSSTPIGYSLALTGTGDEYADFTWTVSTDDAPGAVNGGQSFAAAVIAPVINEFVFSHAGTDTSEYIEVKGAAGADLSAYTLLVIEGESTGWGTIDRVFTVGTTDAAGYWSTGFLPQDTLENGTQTLLLVTGFTGAAGNDLDTDNDGILDATPWSAIVDGVGVLDAGTGEFVYGGVTTLAANFDGVSFTPGGASRIPDGTDTGSVSDWLRNDFDLAGIPGFPGTAVAGEAINTPGAVNVAFEPPVGETVSIADVTIAEGNGGTTLVTFTVTRSGNTGAFSIDYATADGTATTVDGDYDAASGTLQFTAGGDLTATFTVEINGDTTAEPSETFTVTLDNLVATAGSTTIADGSATGTITNDDVSFTAIYELQGIGHRAPVVGGGVTSGSSTAAARFNVEGVITAIAQNGFYMQDATGDGDDRTSDGIFVFTGTNAAILSTIAVGNTMQVLNVQVGEFSANSNNLSGTQLSATSTSGATFSNLGGTTTIDAVVLGVERFIPTGQVSDPGFATYDITTDAADFWESLEGMLVEIPESIATSPTSAFRSRDPINSSVQGPDNNEIWVRVPANTDPDGLATNGGFLLSPTDVNPERIQLDDIRTPIDFPEVTVGDVIGAIQGVVNYDFQNYEVLVSASPVVVTESTLEKEVTEITANTRQITIGTYNVENLDPEIEDTAVGSVAGGDLYTRQGESDDDIGSGQYAKIAEHIAINMGAPTIVALQEVQDNNGAEITIDNPATAEVEGVDSADTLQVLVDLLEATYGVDYAFAYENPPAANIDGGQPNANIRPAFLYRADQVTLVETIRIGDDAGSVFASSRKPLVGVFDFNGVEFTVINNHFNSKGGDNAVFGNVQPPVLSSEIQRIQQAEFVRDYAEGLLAADPNAKIMVLGDLNDFAWSNPNQVLTGDGLFTDLAVELIPEEDRYSYNFQGNAQSLDHTLVNDILLVQAEAQHDIVRVNSEYSDQASDHDPAVTLLDFTAFGETLNGNGANNLIDGGGGNDTIRGRNGRDTLLGGAGDDRLIGGAAADLFVFAPGGGRDRVIDFQDDFDRIDLSGYAALGVDGIEDLTIRSNAAATFIRLDFDASVEIRLLGIAAGQLTEADFVFA